MEAKVPKDEVKIMLAESGLDARVALEIIKMVSTTISVYQKLSITKGEIPSLSGFQSFVEDVKTPIEEITND